MRRRISTGLCCGSCGVEGRIDVAGETSALLRVARAGQCEQQAAAEAEPTHGGRDSREPGGWCPTPRRQQPAALTAAQLLEAHVVGEVGPSVSANFGEVIEGGY